MSELVLEGCPSNSLMGYLKGLGVLRLVAEQKDPTVRGCWRGGVFVLDTTLDHSDLTRFLLDEYRPTPIVVPWSGSDFFDVDPNAPPATYKATPTSNDVIEAFLATTSPRLQLYRDVLRACLAALAACGIDDKDQMKDAGKRRFLSHLRATLPDCAVRWIDACAVVTTGEKAAFNTLLGSGGGSDGNTHFSDNFMQNLWEVLGDFDDQRKRPRNPKASRGNLEASLWGVPSAFLVTDRTSALFDAGAVGGPNAGQGFERAALGNPWSFVLCLEGALQLAGGVFRRHPGDLSEAARASFPFQVRLTATGHDSAAPSEAASFGREVWLPLWRRWAALGEIQSLLSEGRASVGTRSASSGLDFARAASSLGVDRGIEAFQRYALVRGRVGGPNYFTAAGLGAFPVRVRAEIDLLKEIDPWLDRIRGGLAKAPARIGTALRRVDATIMDYCRHGGPGAFASILGAIGCLEQEIAHTDRFRDDARIRPHPGLSVGWLRASWDGSPEVHIATALAGIFDAEGKVEPVRANLEPVARGRWTEHASDVWQGGDLPSNLFRILERRLLDAGRSGCEALALACRRPTSLAAVESFLPGNVDDERIAELLWGAVLLDSGNDGVPLPRVEETEATPPLPRAYALLKLLFLSRPLVVDGAEVAIKPEPAVLALLRAGRIGEACQVAERRLRSSGLRPKTRATSAAGDWRDAGEDLDPTRLAAALMIPIAARDVRRLIDLVLSPAIELADRASATLKETTS